jgi:RNA polymerase sigma-70 factor (ECF subfamily)
VNDLPEFYAAHVRELTLQLFAYTGDYAAAQDAVQEAFCRAVPRWDRLVRYDDPSAWIRRVAWNVATSRWRAMRTASRFAHLHHDEPAAGPNPDHVALVAALRHLPARHRRAVVLHFMVGLTSEEIAAQEGVAASTVRVWLVRGKAALARLLEDRPVAASGGRTEGEDHV